MIDDKTTGSPSAPTVNTDAAVSSQLDSIPNMIGALSCMLVHFPAIAKLDNARMPAMQRPLKIGTRGSPLALYQARLVQSLLSKRHYSVRPDEDFPIVTFTTSGDKLKGELSTFGGKGLFTKELETALEQGDIDIAVHSMKDVPTILLNGHKIGAVLEREDPRDAFISPKYSSIADLPKGAKIGTASLRRRAQLAAMRPDVEFALLRGNVGTRLKKLNAGECDATFLAYAGLKRLSQPGVATEVIGPKDMLNAPAQGAIGIELMDNNEIAADYIKPLNHPKTLIAITAERAFLRALDGSCRTPIAALAQISGTHLKLTGEQLSEDGRFRWRKNGFIHKANLKNAARLGLEMGRAIKREMEYT